MLRLKAETVWIPEALVTEMQREADLRFPSETGGAFMGYRVSSSRETVITDLIGPGPGALFEETRFRPDKEYQYKEIERCYESASRLHTFLGDWHSHPFGVARPSPTDERGLHEIATDPAARQSHPLIAILAGQVDQWDLRMWRHRRTWLRAPYIPVHIRLY